MMRFDMRMVILSVAAAVFLSAAAIFARGCAVLRASPEGGAGMNTAGSPYVTLYDTREAKVLELPLEEYIALVVAAEMPASFEPEALKAQAVAARTYAARRLSAFGGSPCGERGAELCTNSACCQAFRSEEALRERWGEDAAFYLEKIRGAVEATAGIIALYGDEPIEALYHSSSGGATEAAIDVFGGYAPYLSSVESPGEENASHYRDSFTWTKKEFVKAVNSAFPKAKLTRDGLSGQIEILERSEGGRVSKMRLGKTSATGRELRGALELPSAAFTIEISSGGVRINTRGYGHGVGMSQYGANAMAASGAGYSEILSHYYTGITLGSLY